MRAIPFLILPALALSACGEAPPEQDTTLSEQTAPVGEPAAPAPEAPVQAAGPDPSAQPKALAQCKVCHTFDEGGRNGVGPNLWNAHGNPAGGKGDFAYSSALREANITWDDATLDAYLENPRKVIPGGKMAFAGLKQADDRASVIAYLASLKAGAAE